MTAFDNLSMLRAFACIVECGSISAAARRLRVSQPTLSRQLRALEESCGMALLRRDTHQMSLTETGHRFLDDARAILSHATDADLRLHEGHTTLSGHLRVFATLDCGQFLVTRMISRFIRENSAVTVSLSLSNRRLHMIQEGCDAGIVPGRIGDESVIARPVGKITLRLAAAPELVDSRPAVSKVEQLQSWPWIALSGTQFWGAKEITLYGPHDREFQLNITPILDSEGVTSTREAALCGLGVCLLPDWLIADEIASGRLIRLLPQWRARSLPLHVIYAGQRMLPARVSSFIDFAVKYLSAEMKRWP